MGGLKGVSEHPLTERKDRGAEIMTLLAKAQSVREYLTPTLKTSAFLSRGVLTPEEFVKAGDELVYKCPTWTWEAGDPTKRKSHLPADKQYLVTRSVPCTARVSSLENVVAQEGCDDDDGDWLVSQVLTAQEQKQREDKALEDEFDILDGDDLIDEQSNVKTAEKQLASLEIGGSVESPAQSDERAGDEAAQEQDEDDEYADMADFEDDNLLEDEAAAAVSTSDANGGNSNVIKVRTYDISITYDKYYQTPRVWLMGYDSDDSSRPLTGQEMMQDVISDYANRTVTVENHPNVSGPHASIHPCQHGAVMKTIVKNLTKEGEGGKGVPTVDLYLFIFLKFVSSMIPTINYDFTMEVKFG